MYRRRLTIGPYSFFIISIIIIAHAIFSSLFPSDDKVNISENITVINETDDTITIEFNQD